MEEFKNILDTVGMLLEERKDKGIGPEIIKISKSGNWEPIAHELYEAIKIRVLNKGFLLRNLSILHDSDNGKGFTRINIEFIDKYKIWDYVRLLENRQDGKAVGLLTRTLNKAILLLDDYNNMYGDKTCKSKEISELDEVLKSFN